MYLDYETTVETTQTAPRYAGQYLDVVCEQLPVMDRTIREYGSAPLADYLHDLTPGRAASFQKRDDVAETVYTYAAPLLGKTVASTASQELMQCPLVMTANHHGVDFFSQSVQGSLLFSMLSKNGRGPGRTALVFSCGAIPLDNITYPLGMLLYHAGVQETKALPVKLPVFSNRFRRMLVSVAGPIDKAMVQRAQSRVKRMIQQKKISPSLSESVPAIFSQDYGASEVLNQSSYSRQSVVLNSRIWNRLFADARPPSQLLYLELEQICGKLLGKDLLDCNSLVGRILFDTKLRQAVIEELNGAKACWDLSQLLQRVSNAPSAKRKKGNVNGCGTTFFWGITDRGRRIPLCLEADGVDRETLRGVDDRGSLFELAFTPKSIVQALKEKRLLPSLFTCFTVLSFARGIACAGGYYQAEYLPHMQRGLVSALTKTQGYEEVADIIKRVDTGIYLSGMQAVMMRTEKDRLMPAGPAEIIAAGGLTGEDLERIRRLTVRDAHLASLFETVADVAPWATKTPGWRKQLATDCWRLLKGSVVVK